MNLDALLSTLEQDEGFRPFAYDDGDGQPVVPGKVMVGHVTIWFGLCLEQGRVPQLPATMPREALRYVAEGKWLELLMREPWMESLPENTQLGLAMMAYQMGAGGVLGFKRMVAALRAGDFEAAETHALDSNWARQTPARAKRVAALLRG